MIEKYSTISETLLKKWFWLYFFSFIIAPIGYIIKIVISGDVSVSDLWIIYGIISLVTIISAFSDFGVTESLKHFVPQYSNNHEYSKVSSHLLLAFIIQAITGGMIASILFFFSHSLSIIYFDTPEAAYILKVFALFFIGINIFQIFIHFFLAVQNTFLSKLSELVRLVFSLGYISYISFIDAGNLETYSWGWILGLYVGILFAGACFYVYYYKEYLANTPLSFDWKGMKHILQYGFIAFLWAQAGTLLSQVDMQMILLLLRSEDAGYYTVYLSIISIPFLILTPIFPFLLPLFSNLYGQWNLKKIASLRSKMYEAFISIWVITSVFFIVFWSSITKLLFGDDFASSAWILNYSVAFLVFNFLLQINFHALWGIGKVWTRAKIIGMAIIINILLNFLFIRSLWVAGAALATGIWWLIIFLLSSYSLRDFPISLRSPSKTITNILIFSGISLAIYLSNILPTEVSRIQNLYIILIWWTLYFSVFILINKKLIFSLYRAIKKS